MLCRIIRRAKNINGNIGKYVLTYCVYIICTFRTYTCIHAYACVCGYVHIHTYIEHNGIHIYMWMYVSTFIHIHTYIRTDIPTYIHTYIQFNTIHYCTIQHIHAHTACLNAHMKACTKRFNNICGCLRLRRKHIQADSFPRSPTSLYLYRHCLLRHPGC